MNYIKNINVWSRNTKYVISFIFSFVLFIILSPGTFIEITTEGVKRERRNKLLTSIIHAFLFALFLILFNYFYLLKVKKVNVS